MRRLLFLLEMILKPFDFFAGLFGIVCPCFYLSYLVATSAGSNQICPSLSSRVLKNREPRPFLDSCTDVLEYLFLGLIALHLFAIYLAWRSHRQSIIGQRVEVERAS